MTKGYLIGYDKQNHLINNTPFNFDYEKFTEFQISKGEIKEMLLKIRAIDKFNDLSIEAVQRIIRDLPVKSKNGKQSQSIYKLCIKHYEKNKQPLNIFDYKLFAQKNNEKSYFNPKEVFYNGSIKLPKKIENLRAVFNYPKRQSTDNIINFFGIKNLNSIKIEVLKSTKINNKTEEFNAIFETIKPYILAYRMEDIDSEEGKNAEVAKLKNINIELHDNVKYKVDNEVFTLDENDYIKDDKKYLIKITNNCDLNILKSDYNFQASFADILGLEFKILETKDFGKMLDESIDYIEKQTQDILGNDAIINAKELLGISDEFNSFWSAIYKLKNIEYNNYPKDDFCKIEKDLKISMENNSVDYNNLSSIKNFKYISSLFKQLQISISDFNNQAYYKIDFSNYHKNKLQDCFNDNQNNFEQNLYKYCIDSNKEPDFITNKNKYNPSNEDYFKCALEVNYQKICKSFVKNNFDFELLEMQNKINIQTIYDENNSNFDESYFPDKIESLLYFKDTQLKINEYIESNKNIEIPINTINENTILPIVNSTITAKNIVNNNANTKKSLGRYNPNQEKSKKDIGDKSEQKVYDSLCDEFGADCVIWKSKENDNAGYDIKYKNQNEDWKFVEVKTLSNSVFYISKNEKEFAEKHLENYEIYLVSSDKIHKIKPVNFSKLDLIATKFEINYKIS
jgi:hypothetical protein